MVDRKRDIINYFGRPIAPSEIENLIMNIKGVKQVCVVGIPDILSNDLTTALIVKHPGSPLMEDEVSIECSSEKSLMMKMYTFSLNNRNGFYFFRQISRIQTTSWRRVFRQTPADDIQWENQEENGQRNGNSNVFGQKCRLIIGTLIFK